MQTKLHVIDGTFELFRAYFAVPSRRSPDGNEVAAVYGLASSILALMREPDVTHVAAAFDHVVESFRNDLFAGYKTGEGMDPDLWSQFEPAEEALRALGVVVWPMVEFEADDALATAAERFADRVDQVVILSPDKDLMQCVRGDSIITHNRIRKETYDEAAVLEKFGVDPPCIPDLLALVGDTADGIPGLPGWGLKSAAKALAEYGTLENIPSDEADWSVKIRGSAKLSAVLEANRDEVSLYKLLATLRTDVPLQEDFSDLEWGGVPKERFSDFCNHYGFSNLLTRPDRWQ